ncbi:MAG: hypothetical protein ACOCRK_11205 [bacterium]
MNKLNVINDYYNNNKLEENFNISKKICWKCKAKRLVPNDYKFEHYVECPSCYGKGIITYYEEKK